MCVAALEQILYLTHQELVSVWLHDNDNEHKTYGRSLCLLCKRTVVAPIGRQPPDCAAPPSACRRRLRRLGRVAWRAPPLFRGRGGECLNRWPRHKDGAFLTSH